MKKTILALAVALGSTMAFASSDAPGQSNTEVNKPANTTIAPPVISTNDLTRQPKPLPRPENREKKERKPLTPEQFSELKIKHLNMLKNRETVLKGERICAESAKNMDDLKVCFKSARDARREIGYGHYHQGKRHHGEHRKGSDMKRENPNVNSVATPESSQSVK